MKIIGLQPSVLLDNGFFQCITILSKQSLPEHLNIGISFVFTGSICSNIDIVEGNFRMIKLKLWDKIANIFYNSFHSLENLRILNVMKLPISISDLHKNVPTDEIEVEKVSKHVKLVIVIWNNNRDFSSIYIYIYIYIFHIYFFNIFDTKIQRIGSGRGYRVYFSTFCGPILKSVQDGKTKLYLKVFWYFRMKIIIWSKIKWEFMMNEN